MFYMYRYFNEFIFSMELKEYATEGIHGKDIKYQDNQALLDKIMHDKPNLFGTLDEQCNVPRATDSSMTIAFHDIGKTFPKIAGNPTYIAPRGNEDQFSVVHYAGTVKYNSHGFLEKSPQIWPTGTSCSSSPHICKLRVGRKGELFFCFGSPSQKGSHYIPNIIDLYVRGITQDRGSI